MVENVEGKVTLKGTQCKGVCAVEGNGPGAVAVFLGPATRLDFQKLQDCHRMAAETGMPGGIL